MSEIYYFDNAASSPECDASKETRRQYESNPWAGANPNSLHSAGRAAFAALEHARLSVAGSIGAKRPQEVYFTSGGSESNALALMGITKAVLKKTRGSKNRIIISAVEHSSVLDCAQSFASSQGIRLDICPVTPEGTINTTALESLMGPDVALVSVMLVNNETGVIQPVQAAAHIAHKYGALVHTDAIQALGRIPVNVPTLEVDSASFAAHKIGAPVGVGALYVKNRTPIEPLYKGGGQESGMRSGTVDVCGVSCFASVLEDFKVRGNEYRERMNQLMSFMYNHPLLRIPQITKTVNIELTPVAPGIMHLLIEGIHSETLILALDSYGYEVSAGSACSSGSLEPSHVITAMGIPRDKAFGSLRISFDYRTSQTSCEGLLKALNSIVLQYNNR